MTHREIIARALCKASVLYRDEEWEALGETVRTQHLWAADAILAGIEKRGLCIVPVEPDGAMRALGERAWMNRNPSDPKSEPIRDCYRAMISAAPK